MDVTIAVALGAFVAGALLEKLFGGRAVEDAKRWAEGLVNGAEARIKAAVAEVKTKV